MTIKRAEEPVEVTPITTVKRQYPHVDGIREWQSQQSVRLLWDRVFALTEQLTAADATIQRLVGEANASRDRVAQVTRDAKEALAIAQRPEDSTDIEGSEGAGEALPGGGDGGQGAAGLAAAGSTGHIGAVTDFTAFNAGKIVGGTANEFPALLLATAASETGDPGAIESRRANGEELVRRIIWHLDQAGFNAGRQLNESGALSNTRVAVEVENENPAFTEATFIREYDLFIAHGRYWTDMTMQMAEGGGAHLVDDAGIPD